MQLGAPLPEAEPDALPQGAVAQRIWSAVSREPVHVDVVAGRAGMAAHDALAVLLQLELDGHVAQHAGARFSRARSRRNRQVPAG
jgi:predicted Rossmann fold nucleotide-binding protein DprA/Smf involved in DNA uptake